MKAISEKGRRTKAEKEAEKFQDEGGQNENYVWESPLTWGNLKQNGNIKEKAEVGQMYGLSKGASGFKKLKESPN